MGTDGSAIVRLKRACERPGVTTLQIRAIRAELPGPPNLVDSLAVLLAFLDREPAAYPRGAARWQARFALERRVTLTDAQLTLAALSVLPGPGARASAEALIEISDRYGLHRVDDLLGRSLAQRGPKG